MTQKQQTQLTIGLILFNVIFWPLVFFPQLQRFLATFERDVSPATQVVPRQKTSSGMIQRIDYESLRNIFEYAEGEVSSPPRPGRSSSFSPAPRENIPSPQMPPSRSPGLTLQLRSILTLQGRMIATLQDPMVPERMFTVVKGDMVDGYRVVDVTGDAVVLERQGQQIRLTLE
ncbi:hypothetical protein BREVNS_1444 [Brevinematales bacterium NS]|nr:hypothetical protein [Brevinematales bacterium]QJR22194.1 hypothetical protein BREVNS_1444 [Brevinematales bacterium NS]